jgi:tetratricopeptide (TPR) repeat protein
MIEDFDSKIIPNLINIAHAREMMSELIDISRPVIGNEKANELLGTSDHAEFFTKTMLYAILCDHEKSGLYSPDLTDVLLNCRLPSASRDFVGRTTELKECAKLLSSDHVLFIGGVAGIGKSECAKTFADKNKKKYTNIIYLYYSGDLRKDIAAMEFDTDTADMNEEALFEAHYRSLQKLHSDSLIILDNFNVLPKDDAFFKEFIRNDFQLLVTTRCSLTRSSTLTLKELDADTDLLKLFCSLCPSADNATDKETVKAIIREVHSHTLTVVLSALSLSASGMEADTLLHELKSCGLNISDGEDVELYKDGDYTEGLMMEHLRHLLWLGQLSGSQLDILRNLSLLPDSGVLKNHFKNWLNLNSLYDVNHLAKYGFLYDDVTNKKISLHPLIRDIVYEETMPSMTDCRSLVDSLHAICLAHGLEVRIPDNAIQCMLSLAERIINDEPAGYLLFLQDLFPYLEKYLVTDHMPALVERMEYVMQKYDINTPCDKALLLDYKAELFYLKKDYDNALKRRTKAVSILEAITEESVNVRPASLLSNLYNNLSNVYLSQKKMEQAALALRKAFDVRYRYQDWGLLKSHDMLQQMMGLVNMLTIAGDTENAAFVLNQYEVLVTEHEGTDSFDYGCCKFAAGVIALKEGKAVQAEKNLLEAERIFTLSVGTDSAYLRSVYAYLNNLYARWKKPEKALEYRDKLLNVSHRSSKGEKTQ